MSSSATLPPKVNAPPAPDISDLYGDTGRLVAAPPAPPATVPEENKNRTVNGQLDQSSPFLQHVNQATEGAVGMAKAVIAPKGKTETERLKNIAKQTLTEPENEQTIKAGQALNRADEETKAGHPIRAYAARVEAGGHALASGIPLVGPFAASVAEAAGSEVGAGEYGAAAGDVVGNALVGKALEGAGEEAKPSIAVPEHIDMADLGGKELRGPTTFGRTGGRFSQAVNAAFDTARKTAAEGAKPEPEIKTEGPEWDRTHSAYIDGKKVGSVGYKVDPDGRAQIYGSNVDPKLRGQGIGQKLYQSVINEAEENGADRITSDSTNTTPDANRVWDKLKEKGAPIEDIMHPNGKPGYQVTFSPKTVDLSDLGGTEAGETPDHILTGERQSALPEPYKVQIQNPDGTMHLEDIQAVSSKDAIKQVQKKFPDAREWGIRQFGERIPATEYTVPKGKLLSMPEAGYGRTPTETMKHELGHVLVGQEQGIVPDGILRHTHPDLPNTVRAAVRWPASAVIQNGRVIPTKLPALIRMSMGGIAADEVFNDVPRAANHNFDITRGGDGAQAYQFLKDAGYDHDGAMKFMHNAIDAAKEHLQKPEIAAIINENAGVREPNLSKQYHMSGERLAQIDAEVHRRLGNAITDNGTTNAEGKPNGETDVTSGKGEAAPATGSVSPAKITTPEINPEEEGDESFNFGANAETHPVIDQLQHIADAHQKAEGRAPVVEKKLQVDPRAEKMADAYAAAVHEPTNPKVKATYDALKKDIDTQYKRLTDAGFKIDAQPHDPYEGDQLGVGGEQSGAEKAYSALRKDVVDNKHISVWQGGAPPADHPLSKVNPKTGLTYNEMFRAVHDVFGHVLPDNGFDAAGEESAWGTHNQMFSPEARPALATETRGQTAYVTKHGEFANQKATILPEEFHHRPEDLGGVESQEDKSMPLWWNDQLHNEVYGGKTKGGQLIEDAAKNGGFTVHPRTGEVPKDGYNFEAFPERRIELNHPPTSEELRDFVAKNRPLLNEHPDLYVGGYDNKASGKYELNITGRAAKLEDATRTAKKLDQMSIWDNKNQKEITTGGEGLRTQFPNYSAAERANDLAGKSQSNIKDFEHLSKDFYDHLEPDEREYLKGNKTLQRNAMSQYHKIDPSVAETTNAMASGAALGGWWQRYMDVFHDLTGAQAQEAADHIGPAHSEILKQWHAAVSGNKSVEDANNLAWHSYADWLDAGKPTDRTSINNIVKQNAAQPEDSPKKGNAAISDTLDKNGKILSKGLDTSKLFNLVNSPEMRGERPFSNEAFNEKTPNALVNILEGARKLPSMGATVAGKGNLNRLVIDAHIRDFYGRTNSGGPAAQYIADSVHLRQAAEALGLKGGEGQEQLWGTVLGLKQLLKTGLTPEEAAGKLNSDVINQIGKDYAEVIANDPEITKPGGLLDRLKEKYGVGSGSAGVGEANRKAAASRAGQAESRSSQTAVDTTQLAKTAERIKGQISESKIKKPAIAVPAEEPPAPKAPPAPIVENKYTIALKAGDAAAKAKREASMKKGISSGLK